MRAQCALRVLVGRACAALLSGEGDDGGVAAGSAPEDGAIARFVECTEADVLTAKVSALFCTVTFYANLAHSLTRSP